MMTEVRIEAYEMPAADLGAENPLPNFRGVDDHHALHANPVNGKIPQEEQKYIGWNAAQRFLPYRMQDGYNRVKKPRVFKAVILENEHLKVTVLPELGGRVWSIFHKADHRELLDRNPVFQPANLASRNAWFSGGIEWNTSTLGHYYHTCSPVFAAKVKAPAGYDFLRLYEWDRVKCFPYQIDLHLPPNSQLLYAHIRIINPHDKTLPMYWWTNIAVPDVPGVRVLAPAESSLSHSGHGPFDIIPLPMLGNRDLTYVSQFNAAKETYFRIAEGQRKWVAALDREGSGFIQTSTSRLQGRKLFCWGTGRGSKNWQDFLAVPSSRYLEIQAGLGRVQASCIPMPANAIWSWTEAFGLMKANATKVHSRTWHEAWSSVDIALKSILSNEEMKKRDRDFTLASTLPAQEIIQQGSGWGALERKRVVTQNQKDNVPAELVFPPESMGKDQAPWLELLENGSFPEIDANTTDIGQFMIQPEWITLLEESLTSGKSKGWLAWLQLGIAKMEARDLTGAKAAFEASLQAQRNSWALRNLAIVAHREKLDDVRCDFLMQAWEVGPKIVPLAIECAYALLHAKCFDVLRKFISELPPEIRNHEGVLIPAARAALQEDRLEEVEPLFKYEFAIMREGDATLSDIWFEYHEKLLSKLEGIPIDDELKKRVRQVCPPPIHLDFRMG